MHLAAGELLRLDGARGTEFAVHAGCLWITEEARNDDVWLCAGQRARLGGDGLAVVEATRETRFTQREVK